MPSIGVLCTELLRQVKHPKEIEIQLPCSEIVQNLSLMIGFLKWIKPIAGNYKLCQRMSQVIGRVIDQIFEFDDLEKSRQQENQLLQMVTGTMEHDLDWPVEYLDDIEWLNSVDWTQPPFLEFN